MNLGDVPVRQMVVTATGLKARVLGHEPMGTLVLALHVKEIAFGGQIIRHVESKGEVWSNGTQVDLIGQLVLPLD
jgi:hypothetical protein